jgi:DNA-binding FrmR family transcriptional regulator
MTQTVRHVHRYRDIKDVLLARMNRVEGQARGIRKMIEEDRYCPDITQQLTALSSAAREVSLMLLQDHIDGCVTDAIQRGDGEETVGELMSVARRVVRT